MQTTIGTDIQTAIGLLKAGEVVAIPTETVYGLAANGLNENSILRIFEVKNRPRFNPLILHVASLDQLKKYVTFVPEDAILLANKFSPGPITFLLEKQDFVPDLVTAGSSKVAIRIPSHPLALEILSQIDFPLAAPSANVFGYISPVSAAHVFQGLQGLIPYILDGGECSVGLESTICGFEDDKIIIYRLGGISSEEIAAATGKIVQLNLSHEKPDTPGQLKSHYAPHKPLWVGDVDSLMQVHKGKKIAVISFRKKYVYPEPAVQFNLSPDGDLHEAARNLFKALRQLDELEIDIILAERFPESGLGRAINDRLQRAQVVNKENA
jgi:L-threonylcarbamoyladenylate synthase